MPLQTPRGNKTCLKIPDPVLYYTKTAEVSGEEEYAMILEIIGYIGSFLVVISMLMSSIIKLRVINTIGSVISGIYAVICGALPLALMNLCLIIINVVNLVKLLGAKMPYELVEGSAGDSLVKYFLDYYRDDIKTFFPAFAGADTGVNSAFITCCQGTPIGLLLGNRQGDTVDLVVDYTTPAYRDCSAGKYLHGKLPEAGVHTLRFAQPLTDQHKGYLEKMGYTQKDGAWQLAL